MTVKTSIAFLFSVLWFPTSFLLGSLIMLDLFWFSSIFELQSSAVNFLLTICVYYNAPLSLLVAAAVRSRDVLHLSQDGWVYRERFPINKTERAWDAAGEIKIVRRFLFFSQIRLFDSDSTLLKKFTVTSTSAERVRLFCARTG